MFIIIKVALNLKQQAEFNQVRLNFGLKILKKLIKDIETFIKLKMVIKTIMKNLEVVLSMAGLLQIIVIFKINQDFIIVATFIIITILVFITFIEVIIIAFIIKIVIAAIIVIMYINSLLLSQN